MHGAHAFLETLTLVLCVAAVITVVFGRLRQPVVLGYVLAGLLLGRYLPQANEQVVRTLAELGVVLLMFSIGLDFSLRKFVRVAPTSGLTAVVQTSLMIWLGFLVGRMLGWRLQESLYAGAIIAFASTTIVARVFEDQHIRGPLRDRVMGILISEDLIAVVVIAALTAISTGHGLSASGVVITTGKLGAFLIGVVTLGLLVVPRLVRTVTRLDQPDTTVITAIGLCFAIALLATQFGYSVALGAFIAGALVAESGRQRTVEHLVRPVRDLFAALFFVSVGMLIDPALILEHWGAVLVLTLTVVVGQTLTVALGSFLTGASVRTSVQAGLSLAQIGEFSFIIAALGHSLGATGEFLYPVAVAVSAITTLLTPWLIRASGRAGEWVENNLPGRLQTFAALYASWIEQLRESTRTRSTGAVIRRMVRLLLLDLSVLAALSIGGSVWLESVARFLRDHTALRLRETRWLVGAAVLVVSAPFLWGIVRIARRLADVLAQAAFPAAAKGRTDLAAAPRRALVITLQIAIVLMVGAPLVLVTQPFLPRGQGAIALGALLVVLAFGFWRSARNLQGHVRAGAELIAEALASPGRRADAAIDQLTEIRRLLPGLGDPTPVEIGPTSPAAGRTLAELNLRGLTGATVLAILREGHGLTFPPATERVQVGDVLAVAGSHEAIDAARALLRSGGERAPSAPGQKPPRA